MTDFDRFITGDPADFTSGPSTAPRSVVVDAADDCHTSSLSALERFSVGYQAVHGYLSLAVCSFGIVSNALNIIVLTRRSMLNATNCLLTALAVTDLLTMVVYVPYAGYFYCYAQPDPAYGHRYVWIVYLLFNSAFSITAHTVAVWLTVSIAVFRYIVVCGRHSLGARLCSPERARVAVSAVVMTTIVFCVPNYIMYRPLAVTVDDRQPTINWSTMTTNDDERLFYGSSSSSLKSNELTTTDTSRNGVVTPDIERQSDVAVVTTATDNINNCNNCSNADTSASASTTSFWFDENEFITENYRIVNFWIFGVALKVVPCVMLTALSGLLVRAMCAADRRRQRLLNAGRRAESDRAGEHNRTTAMLVAVVLCFVATELPQGVLAFLSGIDSRIFAAVYVPLGDFWDILVLANSAVNFVVYCKMNRRFRRTVVDCFCRFVGLERFGFVVSVGGPEATTATGAMASSRPVPTQHGSMPLYSIVEPSQYTRM